MKLSYLELLMVSISVLCTDALVVTIPQNEPATRQATTTGQEILGVSATVPAQTTITESMTIYGSWISLITIAPLSRNPLQVRQRCFNDQGFSVNCATWTGYYYTWGGAGHPYAGGPGDGNSGSGGNSNNNGITGIISEANRLRILVVSSVVAFSTICLLLVL